MIHQRPERWAFKLADIDGDGLITLGEAQSFARKSVTSPSSAFNRQTGLEGDGAAPVFHWPVAPVKISEFDSPLKAFDTKASDGRATQAWFRKPKGDGPFPTIIFIHGGLSVPAKFAITPRMLMSHSSGLGYGGGQRAAAMAYQAMTKPGTTLKEFSVAVAQEPLLFHPGTSYNYGMGLDILGRYLEAIAGQPLDIILQERLFQPLKMSDTNFYVPKSKLEKLCQIYGQPKPGVLVPGTDLSRVSAKPTLFLGGHGLFGTIGDYERFCRMILNRGELDGVRVLKPETVDLIFENHLKHPTMKYGLGGIVNGAGSYGWGGADGTQFVIDRKSNSFTLFMVQTQHYKAPTYPAFLLLANEAIGITSSGASFSGGTPNASGTGNAFKHRDKNGDGKLGRDELPAALFNRLDANGDGFVTEEELKSLLSNR